MSQSIIEQNQEFVLADALSVIAGQGGQPCLDVQTPACRGRQYLLGASVTDWQPQGHEPVLFTSRRAVFADQEAIRGGVPICFPWFSNHPSEADAPKHGLVRQQLWSPVQTGAGPDGQVQTEMVYNLDLLHVNFRAEFGRELSMHLAVTNPSDSDQRFEAALHTYFAVGDVRQVSVTGLEGVRYTDALRPEAGPQQDQDPITFDAELDRVYHDTDDTCVLHDPSLGRKITVAKTGGRSTVVWNPWVDKAKRMEDFGDDEWPKMCCIESAAVRDDAITLGPKQSHTLSVTITVEHA